MRPSRILSHAETCAVLEDVFGIGNIPLWWLIANAWYEYDNRAEWNGLASRDDENPPEPWEFGRPNDPR